jgi:hypothetical protein
MFVLMLYVNIPIIVDNPKLFINYLSSSDFEVHWGVNTNAHNGHPEFVKYTANPIKLKNAM